MLMPSSIRNLLHLPSRIALLLGLSALSVAGAKADPGGNPQPDRTRVPQQSAKPLADIAIWMENGRIYLSEAGRPAEELRLGNTVEARALRELLEKEGAPATNPHALRDRIILVGGGGAGLHMEAAPPSASADGKQTPPADVSAADQSTSRTTAPRERPNSVQSSTDAALDRH